MIQMKSIIIYLLIFVSSFEQGACKNFYSRFPSCNCFYVNDKTSILCNIADKLKQIPGNFEPIGIVKLGNSSNDCLPGNLFRNARDITEFRLFCPFKCLHVDFVWMPFLALIEMKNTKFSSIPSVIETASSLIHLKLQKGLLSSIGNGLRNLVNLVTLSLDRNRITHINKYSFTRTKKLQSINLSNNKIMTIKLGTFRFCKDITVFLAARNFLQNTKGMPQSTSLQVSTMYVCNIKKYIKYCILRNI